jgi:lipopolysaccharide transport system ATP-binding protein
MYLRLAFAATVGFEPAILVIDEVLAVGDARFQDKCLQRVAEFRAAGKTIVLTSHVPQHVLGLCDEVVVLEEGRLVMRGEPRAALGCYEDLMRQRTERRARQLEAEDAPVRRSIVEGNRIGTQEAAIEGVSMRDTAGQPVTAVRSGQGVTIELEYRLARPLPDLALSLALFSTTHVKCFETLVSSTTAAFGPLGESGRLRCVLPELPLLPGRYYVNVGLYPPDCDYVYDYHSQMHPLRIAGEDGTGRSGVVSISPVWSRVGAP